MNYELHLTFSYADRRLAMFMSRGDWHYSEINGDPQLGPGAKCYMTTHAANEAQAFDKLRRMVQECKAGNLLPIREKIELIIYDMRTP